MRGAAPASTSLCWGTVQGSDLPGLIELAAGAGFPGITVTPAMYFEAVAAGHRPGQLRRRLDDRGVAVTVVDPLLAALPGCPSPAEVHERFRSTFAYGEEQCFEAADALGAPLVNVAHYLGAPTPLDELADALRGVCSRAAPLGLGVTVEFMPEGSITDLPTTLQLLSATGAPNLSVMLDTWHFFRTAGEPDHLRPLAPGVIGALQVSDARADLRGVGTRARVGDRLLPGRGAIGLPEILAIVLGKGVAVDVGVEVFPAGEPPADVAAQAATAVASVLAGAAVLLAGAGSELGPPGSVDR